MAGGVAIEVSGGPALISMLRGYAERASDWTIPFEEIVLSFHAFETEMFETGDGWQPLAGYTVNKKGSSVILVESGKLKSSLTSLAGYQFMSASGAKPFVEVGTTVKYAQYHQHGFVNWINGMNVVARPPVQVSVAEIIDWLDILSRYLFEGFV